jgi:hypothetical protein
LIAARPVVDRLLLADGLAEFDLRAVKPHILRADLGDSQPKRYSPVNRRSPSSGPRLERKPGAFAFGERSARGRAKA